MKRLILSVAVLLHLSFGFLVAQNEEKELEVFLNQAIEAGNINPDSGLILLESLVRSARIVGDSDVVYKSLLYIGVTHARLANFGKSIFYVDKARLGFLEVGDSVTAQSCLIDLGMNYALLRLNDKAISLYLEASEYYNRRSDSIGKVNANILLLNLGNVYQDLEQPEKAEEYLLKGLEMAKEIENDQMLMGAYLNLAIFHLRQKGESVKEYSQKAREICLRLGNYDGLGYLQSELGQYYFEMGEIAMATLEFRSGLVPAGKSFSWLIKAQLLIRLGDLNLAIGNPDSALFFGEKALKMAVEGQSFPHQKDAYWIITEANLAKGRYKISREALAIYIELKDSVFKSTNLLEIGRLENQHEVVMLQSRLLSQKTELDLIVKSEEKTRQVANLSYLASGLLLFLLLGIGISFYYYRLQSSKLLVKERLLTESLEENIDYKSKELVNMASAIAYKNEIIQKSQGLVQIVSQASELSKVKVELKHFSNEINQLKVTDSELDLFFTTGGSILQEFHAKLNRKYSLRPRDLKICSLIRLDLGTKEIAAVMKISIKASEMSKYRLKKKLELSPEIDLYDFLRDY